jgi:hypothetical protein
MDKKGRKTGEDDCIVVFEVFFMFCFVGIHLKRFVSWKGLTFLLLYCRKVVRCLV